MIRFCKMRKFTKTFVSRKTIFERKCITFIVLFQHPHLPEASKYSLKCANRTNLRKFFTNLKYAVHVKINMTCFEQTREFFKE